MQVSVTSLLSWEGALNDCRFTLRKPDIAREPSDRFKRDLIRSEHSPLRSLIFEITLEDIPYFVSVHLCRHHVGVQHFVSTSRPDRTSSALTNHDIPRDTPVNHRMIVNAQAILNISRLRLCAKASRETRDTWQAVVDELSKTEPILAAACVPSCVYRGLCPEFQPCGYSSTSVFTKDRQSYITLLSSPVPQ